MEKLALKSGFEAKDLKGNNMYTKIIAMDFVFSKSGITKTNRSLYSQF